MDHVQIFCTYQFPPIIWLANYEEQTLWLLNIVHRMSYTAAGEPSTTMQCLLPAPLTASKHKLVVYMSRYDTSMPWLVSQKVITIVLLNRWIFPEQLCDSLLGISTFQWSMVMILIHHHYINRFHPGKLYFCNLLDGVIIEVIKWEKPCWKVNYFGLVPANLGIFDCCERYNIWH